MQNRTIHKQEINEQNKKARIIAKSDQCKFSICLEYYLWVSQRLINYSLTHNLDVLFLIQK